MDISDGVHKKPTKSPIYSKLGLVLALQIVGEVVVVLAAEIMRV